MGLGLSHVGAVGAAITKTPLTGSGGSTWRNIGVNVVINAGFGALIAWGVTRQQYWQGAAIGALITLVTATVGAWVANALRTEKGVYPEYGLAVGLTLGSYLLTHWRNGGMHSFRVNVIHGVAIFLIIPMITTPIAHVTGLRI